MECLNQMLSEPYYLFHFLTFFSYLVVRTSAAFVLSPQIINHLFYREIQGILALSLLVAIKIVRVETWEEFIANTLFYAKQPAFQGLGTASKLTPLQLEALLTEGKTTRFWLVEFRALRSSTCVRASRCFPELSITYSNKNLSFGIVDLGLFPNAAEKFGISLGGSMGQLPTYILFENAAEINRFPEFNFEENFSHPPISKKLLSRHFELDRLLVEYVNGK